MLMNPYSGNPRTAPSRDALKAKGKALRETVLEIGGDELLKKVQEAFRPTPEKVKHLADGVGTLLATIERAKEVGALVAVAEIEDHEHRRVVAATLQEVLTKSRAKKC